MNGMLGYLVLGEFKYDEGTKISANFNATAVGWPTDLRGQQSPVNTSHISEYRNFSLRQYRVSLELATKVRNPQALQSIYLPIYT